MRKNIITIIFMIAIVVFTSLVVPRVFQNDTFFAIAVGEVILDNGIDMMEHLTWHEGMSYCYSHWLFDIIIALINNLGGYTGIYIFTIIMANITALTLFFVLRKSCKNEIISFVITILCAYIGNSMFTGRAQVISFLLFIIEVFCIEQFLEKPKKRYVIMLFIIPIIIANIHAATWPFYFIMYLPYIGEYIVAQMSLKKKYLKKKEKALIKLEDKSISEEERKNFEKIIEKANIFINKEEREPYKILISENKNVKKLIIIMLFTIITGLITPIGDTPYTYTIKQLENDIVSSYISEMQPLVPIGNSPFLVLIIVYISMLTFTDTKVKLSDAFFILGFILMTLYSVRSIYYLIWVGAIPLARIIDAFFKKYGDNELKSLARILEKTKAQFLFLILMITWSIYLYSTININVDYINKEDYPVDACEYIINNLDLKNMKIYNGYNYGSYLEMVGIPVFIDSRADIWCKEFNDTTVLEDEKKINYGQQNYMDVFEKYNITHVLIKNDDIIDIYLSEDKEYNEIYKDEYFVLYEKNNF